MSYRFTQVTIRTDNSFQGLKKIEELWRDVSTGQIPMLFDDSGKLLEDIFPVARYSNYESGEEGAYDLSILAVGSDFFQDMQKQVESGKYKKYDACDQDITSCVKLAWQKVWEDDENGSLSRAYSADYEQIIPPKYSQDGKAHCFLYIAVD